jgi:glycerophosphoryl diester phosphodiesterase
MTKQAFCIEFIVAFCLFIGVSMSHATSLKSLIDLTDSASIKDHQPLLIAHRGGVVISGAPENSLKALHLAAKRGYAMVEVDIRESKDHVPYAFHDDTLMEACGIESRIEDMNSSEIDEICYINSTEKIVSLDTYLALCNQLSLGVMLDIKTIGSEQFFKTIRDLLLKNKLEKSTVSIARPKQLSNITLKYLNEVAFLRLTDDEMKEIEQGTDKMFNKRIWFDWPRFIKNETVKKLQKRGVLVIPSINVFHYPKDKHMQLAEKDIRRMQQAGVDAYQIDAVYDRFFDLPTGKE